MSALIMMGAVTPKELEGLLEQLPASDRAALRWTVPALRKAVQHLLEEEPTEKVIAGALRQFADAVLPVSAALLRLAVSDDVHIFRQALQDRLRELMPQVQAFLGQSEHAVRLARTLLAMAVSGALAVRMLSQDPVELDRLDEWLAAERGDLITRPEGAGIRAAAMVAAVLEAAERGEHLDRARQLIERADAEGWAIASLLSTLEVPGGGRILVPGYFAPPTPREPKPVLRTELGRELWEQRQRTLESLGRPLTDEEVEAELAARRGGADRSC
jgi:hypothetical protein